MRLGNRKTVFLHAFDAKKHCTTTDSRHLNSRHPSQRHQNLDRLEGDEDRRSFSTLDQSKEFVCLAMAWHRRQLADSAIYIHRVAPSLAQERTAVLFQIAQKIESLYPAATISGSRITVFP